MGNIIVLLVGEIALLLLLVLFADYNFVSPAFVIDVIFIGITLMAIRFYSVWEYDYSPATTQLILLGLAVFELTELVFRFVFKKTCRINRTINYVPQISKLKINLFLAYSLIVTILLIYDAVRIARANGYGGGISFSAIASFTHDSRFIEGRAKTSSFVNLLAYVFQSGIYICIYYFFCNVIIKKQRILKNMKLWIPFILYTVQAFLKSGRAETIMMMAFGFVCSYVLYMQKKNWRQKKRVFAKTLKKTILVLVLVIAIFFVTTNVIGRSTRLSLLDYLAVYTAGPIIHLNQFIQDPPSELTAFGVETFGDIYAFLNRLGITDVQYTLQLEVRNITPLYKGNVYTFFRRPYHDFGLWGMIIVVFLTSLLMTWIFYGRIYRKGLSKKTIEFTILFGYLYRMILLFYYDNYWCHLVSLGMVIFFIVMKLLISFMFERVTISSVKHREIIA